MFIPRSLASGASLGVLCLATCLTKTAKPRGAPPEAVAARAELASAPRAAPTTTVDGAPSDSSELPGGAIDAAVEAAIARHDLPGAVVVVGRHDRVLFRRAYGFREREPHRVPMTLDTVFDLASLTKPIATATSIMALVERGAIDLDDRLVKYVPECDRKGKAAITIRQLLLHVSGLPADIPKERFASGRAEALRHICDLTPRATPGETSIYSDLGFILLEEVVRRVSSRDLAAFAAEIFASLGLRDTSFLPDDEHRRRAAWTELVDGSWRAGVVHDPRAYLLGGVAGHAGLFSTADDLALYARAMLGGGEVDGKRMLTRHTVSTMIAAYDVPGSVRALGWAVDSTWRGEGLSPRAFGHFGFTGTALWIDPDKDLFTIMLSNRVHPDGKGDAKPLVARINTLAAEAIGPRAGGLVPCGSNDRDAWDPDAAVAEGVRTGIDVLRDEGFARLRGARVGLITNEASRAREGTSTVDILANAPGVTLVALFAPEHGLDAGATGEVADGRDARTGLPIYSLYGASKAPTKDSLAGIDTLVFDLQDVGTRFFTYASTMHRALRAASAHDVRFLLLDRPDPIDGVDVAGPVFIPQSGSFVNHHSLPIRHGMTMGELATLINADDHLGVALSVVPMRGWRREQYADETGLPWVSPSPNLRSVAEVLLYPAVGLLEATNLSVGRGTDTPFEQLGAPWIDAAQLASALAAENLEGIAIVPTTFTPSADRYAGQECHGVHLAVTDRTRFEPVRVGLAIARALRRMYRRAWTFEKLDRLLVHPEATRAIDGGSSLDAIIATYRTELTAFIGKRQKYLLYGTRDCADSPAAALLAR